MAAQCPRNKSLCDQCELSAESPDCLSPLEAGEEPPLNITYCDNFKERN